MLKSIIPNRIPCKKLDKFPKLQYVSALSVCSIVFQFIFRVTTQKEWELLTHNLLQNSSNEIASSKQLRSFADLSLNQSVEDVTKQVNRTTEAFYQRIGDLTYAKTALETQQNQTHTKLTDIKANLVNLQTELEAKEQFLVLCQNRLENRALRPGTELCKDRVHGTLVNEMETLQQTIHHLKHMMHKVKSFSLLIFGIYLLNFYSHFFSIFIVIGNSTATFGN